MSALGEIYIKKETLEMLLKGVNAKGITGIGITLSINDEAKVFRNGEKESRQNISAYVSQSKEDREANKEKYYVGNGGIFWTNGSIKTAKDSPEKGATFAPNYTATQLASTSNVPNSDEADLPF